MGPRSLNTVLQVGKSLGWRTLAASLGYAVRWQLRRMRRRYITNGDVPAVPAALVRRLPRRRASLPEREPLGDLASYRASGSTVDLFCHNGVLRLEVLASDLVRLRLRRTDRGDFPPLFSYALDAGVHWPDCHYELEESEDGVTLRTSQFSCHVTKVPCRLAFYDAQSRPLSEPALGLGFWGSGVFCTRRLDEGEAIYGLGQRAFDLNLRGRALEMWNTDPAVYSPGDDPINLCVPVLAALRKGRACGFLFDNPGRARFDLGQTEASVLRYEADSGELCAYFFAGPTLEAVLERYTHLTGRMPLPPVWMLGYHQSRWSYYPDDQVRSLAAEFRQRRIPCDAIHLDIHHMDGYRIFTWDSDRFPDPPALLADLREQGYRVITIVDPGVKVDPNWSVYNVGLHRDAFCRLATGQRFRGQVWPGTCCFPDFTDPAVRRWWGKLYKPLLQAGVAGFWNDMNEPAVFGGEMPGDVRHSYEGIGALHGQIHNVYGLQMARASAEGLRELCPDQRIPLISRSGYAGLQRYAMVWTADNQSTWAQLRLGVSMCINLGLSGLAFCGPDVGGFAGNCDGELLARWTQVGALTPFFRNHSALGTERQEPWAFGEPYETICRQWIELRYQLLPYLYTAAWQASNSGLPMMRPLALAFPDDTRTLNLSDQFLLGDALLAAPVGQPGLTSRGVYLPAGDWYDFWTGERRQGFVIAPAPLERMPVFVRAGSVLPMGPVTQHTGDWPPQRLRLDIYPGDGESRLYEDDGHSLAFQSGACQVTRWTCEQQGKRLTVQRQVEGRFEAGCGLFETVIHGLTTKPDWVTADGQPVDWEFDGALGVAALPFGRWNRLEIGWPGAS